VSFTFTVSKTEFCGEGEICKIVSEAVAAYFKALPHKSLEEKMKIIWMCKTSLHIRMLDEGQSIRFSAWLKSVLFKLP
jgi:isopentenyldiphosphate isomerase